MRTPHPSTSYSLGILWILCLLAGSQRTQAAEEPLDKSLNEQVLSIPGDPSRPVLLEVTTFSPDGPGPFPLAVLNHGKESGKLSKDEPRYRSAYLARYFLSRGYFVALPMLRGFADSGGVFNPHGFDVEACGLGQVTDLSAVIDYLSSQPNIDGSRIIVAGQSMGGWNTLAFATRDHPGVKGYLNFAGGIRETDCPTWQENLIKAAGHYGRKAKLPSLWFYGDNDSVFPPTVWRPMYEHYVRAGGPATLIAYGSFITDAHNMIGSLEGFKIWMPKVDDFLTRLGLPGKLIEPRYLPSPFPPPTNFAALDDLNAVPYLKDRGRSAYQAFLQKPFPRVFLLSKDGKSASFAEGFDPLTHGLEECHKLQIDAQVYAVDNHVVWVAQTPTEEAQSNLAAANQGDALAMFRLSEDYVTGTGVPQNGDQALSWLQMSAEKGLSLAQNVLGVRYEKGIGVIKNYPQALFWLHKSADQGNVVALNQIGNMYVRGWGVTQDYQQALTCYHQAAEAGLPAAQYDVGYLYEKGFGVTRDPAQARLWYQKAANQGLAQATQALVRVTATNSSQ